MVSSVGCDRLKWAAATAVLAAFLSPAARAEGCNDLSRPACIAAALERADGELNDAYVSLLKSSTESRAEELRVAQRAWIEARNRTCRLPRGSTIGQEWIEKLVIDAGKALCVYGNTTARVEELHAMAREHLTDESSLKEMNDFGVPLTRRSGKGYAEIEFVARGFTAENTRIMQMGATSDAQAFIGMQVTGDDMATVASDSGVYTFGMAIDFDNAKWYWSQNGQWQNGEPGSAQGTNFQIGGNFAMRVMSPARPIQVDLSRGGIVINTGKSPFRYAMPAGYQPFHVPSKSAAGEAYLDWIVPSYRNVSGLTLGQWAQRYWAWLLSKPASRNPVDDTTGELCADDQAGPVWFLAGGDARAHVRRKCRVPRGKYLFLPAFAQLIVAQKEIGKTCADLEKQQIGKLGFGAQRDVFVRINGERFDSLLEYRPYSTKCAPITTVDGRVVADQAMLYGTFVLLQPLPPGDHVIEFGGNLPELEKFRAVSYELQVD